MTTPIAGGANATFIWSRSGSPRDVTVTLGLMPADTPWTETPGGIAFDLYGLVTATGRPCAAASMLVGYTFQGVVFDLQDDTGSISGEYRSAKAGTGTGGAVPPNCSLLIKKNTTLGGRRNRGRMFWPPTTPDETGVDSGGVIASATLPVLQAYWTSWFAALIAANYQPVVFHSIAPYTPAEVTGFTLQSLLATQRRRLRK